MFEIKEKDYSQSSLFWDLQEHVVVVKKFGFWNQKSFIYQKGFEAVGAFVLLTYSYR